MEGKPYLQIGDIRLILDEDTNSFKVDSYDENSQAGLYASGGVSAFGQNSGSGGGGGGGGEGTTDYEQLQNKPKIEGLVLSGNKTLDQLGAVKKEAGKGLIDSNVASSMSYQTGKVKLTTAGKDFVFNNGESSLDAADIVIEYSVDESDGTKTAKSIRVGEKVAYLDENFANVFKFFLHDSTWNNVALGLDETYDSAKSIGMYGGNVHIGVDRTGDGVITIGPSYVDEHGSVKPVKERCIQVGPDGDVSICGYTYLNGNLDLANNKYIHIRGTGEIKAYNAHFKSFSVENPDTDLSLVQVEVNNGAIFDCDAKFRSGSFIINQPNTSNYAFKVVGKKINGDGTDIKWRVDDSHNITLKAGNDNKIVGNTWVKDGYLRVGDIYISYDETAGALKLFRKDADGNEIEGGIYATGFMSAFGSNASSGGGGGGGWNWVNPTTTGNGVAAISFQNGDFKVVYGTFLTEHQSLDGKQDVITDLQEIRSNAYTGATHATNKSNPHGVTKAQVGLGNCDNTADANKRVAHAATADNATSADNATTHIAKKDNPHEVTKAQVGLGNCANTADKYKSVSHADTAGLADYASELETSRSLWGNEFNGSQDIFGNIVFNAVGTWPSTAGTTYPLVSNGIKWSGESDSAGIYYEVTGSNNGRLVLNVGDDGEETAVVCHNGTPYHFFGKNGYTISNGTASIPFSVDENGNLKIDGNVYATGSVSAFGSSSGGGSGTGGWNWITPTTSGNGVASISYSNGNFKVTYGNFLTQHQSLAGKQDVITDLAEIRANASTGATHSSNTNNPHSVTKAQVGLGNVDNTADANKIVSTAKLLRTSAIASAMYVTNDSHYMRLGYMECTDAYDRLTLLVSSAFWGNQHSSQDIITIAQDLNNGSSGTIQCNVGRVNLHNGTNGAWSERTFYYKKDNGNKRLYLYVYVTGGNSYGHWSISCLGGSANWVTEGTKNVSYEQDNWIKVPYTGTIGNADTLDGYHHSSFLKGATIDVGFNRDSDTPDADKKRTRRIARRTFDFTNRPWDSGGLSFDLYATGYGNYVYIGSVSVVASIQGDSNIWYNLSGWTLRTESGGNVEVYLVKNSNILDVYVQNNLWDSQITAVVNYNNSFAIGLEDWCKVPEGAIKLYPFTIRNNAITSSSCSGNSATAIKLANSRTLWGQSFDGSSNISGSLTSVGNVTPSANTSYDLGTNATSFRYIYGIWFGSQSGKEVNIAANNAASHIHISTSGNVGIGTTTPEQKLSVAGWIESYSSSGDYNGGISIGRKSAVGGSYNSTYTGWQIHNYKGDLQFLCDDQCSVRLQLNRDGNVGIGTISPVTRLHITQSEWDNGITLQRDNGTGGAAIKVVNASANYLGCFGVTGSRNFEVSLADNSNTDTTRLFILGSSGNVGIGTTSPSAKLDVSGDIRISDNSTIYFGDDYSYIQGYNSGELKIFSDSGTTIYSMDCVSIDASDVSISCNTTVDGNVLSKGAITAFTTSDERLKDNIEDVDCIEVIKTLGGIKQFDYKKDGKHGIGVIAQNVQNSDMLNDIVFEREDGTLAVNYLDPKLVSLALGAAEQLSKENEELKARVEKLENLVEQLIKKLDK